MKKFDRNFVFTTVIITCLSGVFIYLLEEFFKIETEYGLRANPWIDEAKLFHNILNFVFIFSVGKIFNGHIIHGLLLKKKNLRVTGFLMSFLIVLLTLSGCLLLYNSEGFLSGILDDVHFYGGLSLFVVFIVHFFLHIRLRKVKRSVNK